MPYASAGGIVRVIFREFTPVCAVHTSRPVPSSSSLRRWGKEEVDTCPRLWCSVVMDKQIRIDEDSHAALKEYAKANRLTVRRAVEVAISGLHLTIVVAVNAGANHDVVEAYMDDDDARERVSELVASGFLGRDISRAHRRVLECLEPLRKYGPEWKDATGWTATAAAGEGGSA